MAEEAVIANAPVLFETIETSSGHRFGRATLNVPASLNALSLAMVDLLDPQLAAWADDATIAGVVLDAAGPKAFCAGGDVVGLYRAIRSTTAGEIPPDAANFFEREYRLDYRIHRYPKPLLCWGHGIVMGGGIGLHAGASHRVVTPQTRMAMPEIGIGLYPDVGGSWLLSRLPRGVGLFLALTGASLNASDARFLGMADIVLPHDRHDAVLESIAAARWTGVRGADHAQLSHLLQAFVDDVPLPPSAVRTHYDRIDAVIGNDELVDIASRLSELAADPDPWLAQAGTTFIKGSPTSAALSVALQRRARHLSLADAFRLEWQASVGCCLHHDFAEGVRALLVDKDKSPRWSPSTLSDVTPDLIASHLRPHHRGANPLADLL
ncbi:enoyl-CoA hydratase/isomerase family protein [Gemmatimonas aurantiaca]|uniref:enoyl-CoA hydratase/isomerase family protein n=1 Tax=Gemmatimonas aurantiaca TaxID=173480 RepID=UPI00301D3D87